MARADGISGYALTDLGPETRTTNTGPVNAYTISNTGAGGTLSIVGGNTYAFQSTNNLVSNPGSLLNSFPPFANAPMTVSQTQGNSNWAYSKLILPNVFLNQSGLLVATDVSGVNGQSQPTASTVYASTRQANGTFSALTPLWSTADNQSSGGLIAHVVSLNNSGQMLGVSTLSPTSGTNAPNYILYDIKTGVTTSLQSLLPLKLTVSVPIAIDDQGRILLDTQVQNTPNQPGNNGSGVHDELVLLTPASLSSAPLAAPEPTTLVTLAVAGVALVVRRRWKTRPIDHP